MGSEERKFLDLDMVAEAILHLGDQSMFREALTCYHVGSHRGAVILVWSATVDCMRRWIDELATEGDGDAVNSRTELGKYEGQATYEQQLIAECANCKLIDDYERKCLDLARHTRSKCAHPTGVNPSAEAVRHIFRMCSEFVLCRKGYRGMAYIREVVTTRFDNPFFLPTGDGKDPLHDAKQIKDRCLKVIERVPNRLWKQFTATAAAERGSAPTGVWRRNALEFYASLLETATDAHDARDIAKGMEGFRAGAPEFFATLVGLDLRVTQYWELTTRQEALDRLSSLNLAKVTTEPVRSWANLCTDSELQEKELDVLRSKIAAMARHLPNPFLTKRREQLYKLLAEMAEKDATAEQTAAALKHLFPSVLGDETNEDSSRILQQMIIRFGSKDKSKEKFVTLVASCNSWKSGLLLQFLEQTESFLAQCGEDEPDDVLHIFVAATEFAERNISPLPPCFFDGCVKVLKGEILPGWRTSGSKIGSTFVSQLTFHRDRHRDAFSQLDAHSALIGEYERAVAESEDGA